LAAVAVFATSGCSGCNDSQTAQAQQYVADADDLDLNTVLGLIKTGAVSGTIDVQAIENRINDPASGINNVDIDHDGKIDYISLQEAQRGNVRAFELLAYPSAKPNAQQSDAIMIAEVTLTADTVSHQVIVGAAYPDYMNGYNTHYYPGLTIGDALFMSWLLSPSRVMYMPHYYGYVPRPIMAPGMMHATRTTFRTTTKVGPVPMAARPANYAMPSAQKYTVRAQSQYALPAKTGTIGGNANQMKNYGQRPATQVKQGGRGFLGGQPQAPTRVAPTAPPHYTPPSGQFRSYSPPAAPSRPSFGGSSRPSFGGGSFGGGRRR
jgi:hypothetical protein